MSDTDLIALGALIVAFISLVFSIKSYVVSKSAYLISKQQHDDKYKKIAGYLIDSYKWKNDSSYFSSFAISYTNNASEANSFKDIYLEISYYDELGAFNKAKLSPIKTVLPLGLREDYQEMIVPVNLVPKETKSGWITFNLPTKNSRSLAVDSYKVVAVSTSGEHTIIESFIIKMVTPNEEA